MTNNFYQNAIDDACRTYLLAKEFIEFVVKAHGEQPCQEDECPTMAFCKSLKNFFSDDNNTFSEKKNNNSLLDYVQKIKTFLKIYTT